MVNLSVWCHAATDVVTITCIVDVFCLFTHVQGSTVGERVIILSLVLSLSREANSLSLLASLPVLSCDIGQTDVPSCSSASDVPLKCVFYLTDD